ncbi:MAG: cupin domain-containing protein [Thermaerobacterales bacterium]
MSFRPTIRRLDDCPEFNPIDGVSMRGLIGDRIHGNLVEIRPGASVPVHGHQNEQFGYILAGELILTLGDQEHRLQAGCAYTIPPHLPHSGRGGPEGCKLLDFFTPARDDYPAARS